MDRCFGLAGDEAAVIAASLQHQTEVSAAVGGRDESRQRRDGRDIEAGRAGGAGPGQGAGRDDDPVVLIVCRHAGADMVEQDRAGHDLSANGAMTVFVRPWVLGRGPGVEVDH